jgi:hypothetical protein
MSKDRKNQLDLLEEKYHYVVYLLFVHLMNYHHYDLIRFYVVEVKTNFVELTFF